MKKFKANSYDINEKDENKIIDIHRNVIESETPILNELRELAIETQAKIMSLIPHIGIFIIATFVLMFYNSTYSIVCGISTLWLLIYFLYLNRSLNYYTAEEDWYNCDIEFSKETINNIIVKQNVEKLSHKKTTTIY